MAYDPVENLVGEQWIMVGARSENTLLVCGGVNPIAIRVNHPDSAELLKLITDANAGIAMRERMRRG